MRKGEKLPLAPLGGESRFLPICDLSSKSRRWANLLITKHELCLTLRAQNAQRPPGGACFLPTNGTNGHESFLSTDDTDGTVFCIAVPSQV